MKKLLTILLLAGSTAFGQQVDTVNFSIFGDAVKTEFKFAIDSNKDYLGCTLISPPINAQATVPAFYGATITEWGQLDTLSATIMNVYDLGNPPAPLMNFPRRPPVITLQCILRERL